MFQVTGTILQFFFEKQLGTLIKNKDAEFLKLVQPFLFFPIISCVGSGAVCIRNTDPDLYRRYSEYGSGSTQLLNTGPICIRIYNIG